MGVEGNPKQSTPQNILQRILQHWMLEPISARCKLRRFRALAAEKEFFAHFSKDQLDGEGGHGEDRRPVQDGSQCAGELSVGHGIGRDGIHRALKRVVIQHVLNRAHNVIDRDPA